MCGHQFAEVYVASNERKGVWLPVDPALEYLFTFPKSGKRDTFSRVALPKFDDKDKTAQIKINYI